MEELKIKKMIRDVFNDESLDDEDISMVVEEINKNELRSETEILKYLQWLKEEMSTRVIDDSEFDEE